MESSARAVKYCRQLSNQLSKINRCCLQPKGARILKIARNMVILKFPNNSEIHFAWIFVFAFVLKFWRDFTNSMTETVKLLGWPCFNSQLIITFLEHLMSNSRLAFFFFRPLFCSDWTLLKHSHGVILLNLERFPPRRR